MNTKNYRLIFPDYEEGADDHRLYSMSYDIRKLGGKNTRISSDGGGEAYITYEADEEAHKKILAAAEETGLGWYE